METIKISELDRNGLQTRVALDEQTVNDYAEAMRGRAKFPPVIVFKDSYKRKLYLADGFHRVEAAQRAGFKAVKADVKAGTFADALKYALGANANHGLRRSNADKQRALEMAWNAREELFGGEPSIALLAETCGVSVATVKNFRAANRVAKLATLPPTRNANNGGISPKAEVISKTDPMRNLPPEGGESGRTTPPPERPAAAPSTPPVKRVGRDGKTYTVPPVRKAAPTRKSGHAPNVMLDRFGVEIPMEIRDAFTGETARDQIESMLQSAYRLLKGAMEAQDPSVAQFRQADLIDLQNAVRTARFTKPYCVCRICQGNGRWSCSACHETGFQTEEQYKRNPKEFLA